MFHDIPHASFPFDESPWIRHFHDSVASSRRSQLHAAGAADEAGSDLLARHIMAAGQGVNPFATYRGPFHEGAKGRQFVPHLPPQLYSEYFGDYSPPGAAPGMGPFADPTQVRPPGVMPGSSVFGPAPGSLY